MKSARRCTTDDATVLSIKRSHMPDDTTSRELTDEELETVIGGRARESFEIWRCEMINELNAIRKNEQRHSG